MSVSDLIGLVGGIVGLIGGCISVAAYARDNARLRVKLTPNMKVLNRGMDSLVRDALAALGNATPPANLYYRDPDRIWTEIEIINVGRRPIRVTAAGFITFGKSPYLLLADWEPRMLNEGESGSITSDQAELPIVRAAFARKVSGRSAYGGFRKSIFGAKDRVLAALAIAPFK